MNIFIEKRCLLFLMKRQLSVLIYFPTLPAMSKAFRKKPFTMQIHFLLVIHFHFFCGKFQPNTFISIREYESVSCEKFNETLKNKTNNRMQENRINKNYYFDKKNVHITENRLPTIQKISIEVYYIPKV